MFKFPLKRAENKTEFGTEDGFYLPFPSTSHICYNGTKPDSRFPQGGA